MTPAHDLFHFQTYFNLESLLVHFGRATALICPERSSRATVPWLWFADSLTKLIMDSPTESRMTGILRRMYEAFEPLVFLMGVSWAFRNFPISLEKKSLKAVSRNRSSSNRSLRFRRSSERMYKQYGYAVFPFPMLDLIIDFHCNAHFESIRFCTSNRP